MANKNLVHLVQRLAITALAGASLAGLIGCASQENASPRTQQVIQKRVYDPVAGYLKTLPSDIIIIHPPVKGGYHDADWARCFQPSFGKEVSIIYAENGRAFRGKLLGGIDCLIMEVREVEKVEYKDGKIQNRQMQMIEKGIYALYQDKAENITKTYEPPEDYGVFDSEEKK